MLSFWALPILCFLWLGHRKGFLSDNKLIFGINEPRSSSREHCQRIGAGSGKTISLQFAVDLETGVNFDTSERDAECHYLDLVIDISTHTVHLGLRLSAKNKRSKKRWHPSSLD